MTLRTLGVLLATTPIAAPLAAQAAVEIDRSRTCPGCRIVREHLGQIGDPAGDSISLRHLDFPEVLGDSVAWVAPQRGLRSHIAQFSLSTGTNTRIFGRAGDGPGEHRALDRVVVGPADSLWVFEPGRVTIYPPGATVPARQLRLRHPISPMFVRPIVFEDGSYLVARNHHGPDFQRHPLHLIGSDGVHARSFAGDGHSVAGSMSLMDSYELARAGEGRVWFARSGALRFEEWDTAGVLLRVLESRPEWFPEPTVATGGSAFRVPTRPFIVGIWADSTRLWVFTRIAEPPEDFEPMPPGRFEFLPAFGPWVDTRVWVVETATGRLLYEDTFEEDVRILSDRELIVGESRTDEYGSWIWDVYRLRLEGLPGG